MTPQRIALDKAMVLASPAETLQVRTGDLAVAFTWIAGFKDHERELLDLIEEARLHAESGSV